MLHYTHYEVCIFHDGPLEWSILALLSQRKTHSPLFSACCKNVPAKAGALLCLPCVWETTQTRQQFRRETWTPGSGCRHQAERGRDLCPLWHQKGLISRNACFSKPFLKTRGRVKEVKGGLFFIPERLDRHIFGILSWDLQIPKKQKHSLHCKLRDQEYRPLVKNCSLWHSYSTCNKSETTVKLL